MTTPVTQEALNEANRLLSGHIGAKVAANAVHGSILRGFNDPNSDVDVCFLVDRPVSDYMNMSTTPFFEGTIDDRKERLIRLSKTMSRELGWEINISILDMRSLARGIMSSSTFALMAYERFSADSARIQYLFDTLAKDFYSVPNLVHRCGDKVASGMRGFRQIPKTGSEYKQERTYLGTLWLAHRLLAYLGGDTQHCRTIQELIELNREKWEGNLSEGFQKPVVGVFRSRVERSPFDLPAAVPEKAVELLEVFSSKVLTVATGHLLKNPKRFPTVQEESIELVDLYAELIDEDKTANDKLPLHVVDVKKEALAA